MGCLKGKWGRVYEVSTECIPVACGRQGLSLQSLVAWPKQFEGNQRSLRSILTSISGMLFRFKGLRM